MFRILGYILLVIAFLFVASAAFVIFSPYVDAGIVRSESMKPALAMGDLAIMRSPADIASISPGEIVSFTHGERLIAHRVYSIEEDGLITKGDALEQPDPWVVPFADVQGVFLFKIPYFGYFARFIGTTTAWVALVIFPALLLIALFTLDLFRKNRDRVPAKSAAVANGSGYSLYQRKAAGSGRTAQQDRRISILWRKVSRRNGNNNRRKTATPATRPHSSVSPPVAAKNNKALKADNPRGANLTWKGGDRNEKGAL